MRYQNDFTTKWLTNPGIYSSAYWNTVDLAIGDPETTQPPLLANSAIICISNPLTACSPDSSKKSSSCALLWNHILCITVIIEDIFLSFSKGMSLNPRILFKNESTVLLASSTVFGFFENIHATASVIRTVSPEVNCENFDSFMFIACQLPNSRTSSANQNFLSCKILMASISFTGSFLIWDLSST